MIAIDIGGSHISSLVITDILEGKFSNDIINSSFDGKRMSKNEILDIWSANIRQSIHSANTFDGNLAFAIPGPFDYVNGIFDVHPKGKFSSLEGINIKEELYRRIPSYINMYFNNDAACFGIGEYFYGLREMYSKVLGITLGTGVGSAFVHQGNIIKDANNVPFGGEVYHLPLGSQIADDCFSTRWFVRESEIYGLKVSGVKELISLADEKVLENIFGKFSKNFISFFSPIVNNFQANCIVIGGNISKAWTYFSDEIVLHFNKKGVDIVRSEIGEKMICLGAARSMYNQSSI